MDGFQHAIERVLDERATLRDHCLARRDAVSVDHAVDRLVEVYDAVLR